MSYVGAMATLWGTMAMLWGHYGMLWAVYVAAMWCYGGLWGTDSKAMAVRRERHERLWGSHGEEIASYGEVMIKPWEHMVTTWRSYGGHTTIMAAPSGGGQRRNFTPGFAHESGSLPLIRFQNGVGIGFGNGVHARGSSAFSVLPLIFLQRCAFYP